MVTKIKRFYFCEQNLLYITLEKGILSFGKNGTEDIFSNY